jgi:uracil-DNA glycosylase
LWKDATQTVFGAGPRTAELMLVGEQPGDKEDLAGEPFVGPAGPAPPPPDPARR